MRFGEASLPGDLLLYTRSLRVLSSAVMLLGLRACLMNLGCFLALAQFCAAMDYPVDLTPGNNRRALAIGYGVTPGTKELTHANAGRNDFLNEVGNPKNDPRKGWTCDFTWDLMQRLGMDPTNTPVEALFKYIGQHRLGYRIAIVSGPFASQAGFWGAAVDNGIMPFGASGNNNHEYYPDPVGLHAAVGVAGGRKVNDTSWGPAVEIIDAITLRTESGPYEDPAQSWANQAAAARFARVLDAHPEYNVWDARQHMRQAASFWAAGWNATNGYGKVNERAWVGKLLPGPPVDFQMTKSRNRSQVRFGWRNFLQTDYAATVIARKDGRVLYRGTGTGFDWKSDLDGSETFLYWSENRAGDKSRLESYQARTVSGLCCTQFQTCLVVEPQPTDDSLTQRLSQGFQQGATNWVCDLIRRPAPGARPFADPFALSMVLGSLPDLPAMVSYALTNHYRILLAPLTLDHPDPFADKAQWDRGMAAGVLVVLPHNASPSRSRKPQARRTSPPRLFSAITVGAGWTNNLLSFGPGLEFFDGPGLVETPRGADQLDAAAIVAGKLARILDANPGYNAWDARQHLRQCSSYYEQGWREDGGFGRPTDPPLRLPTLDPAPPLDIQAVKSADGKTVRLSWQNFLQSSFDETVIQRGDGRVLYHGTGGQFAWQCDTAGEEKFRFFTRDRQGRLSREAPCTVIRVSGLAR